MKLSLLLVALTLLPAHPGGESDFERGFGTAKQLAQTKRWSQAKSELDRLLAAHENKSYAVARLSELTELYRRCRFFESYPMQPVKSLVGGELTEWNERTSEIGLTYTNLSRDFQSDGAGALVHPIEFSGPYSIELHGRMGPAPAGAAEVADLPQVLVLVDGSRSHQLSFGCPEFTVGGSAKWIPPRILRNGSGPAEILDEASQVPLTFGERFKLTIAVTETRLDASVDGRLLLSAAKSPELFGRVAILNLPGLSRVMLRGKTDGAWLTGLQERAREEEWQKFRASWRLEDELPAWVGEQLKGATEVGSELTLPFQIRVPGEQLPALQRMGETYQRGEYEAGLRQLQQLSPLDLAPEIQTFFKALFELRLERRTQANATIDTAIASAPEFFEARLLKGRILGELGHKRETLQLFAEFVEKYPKVPVAWTEYASWCLRFGRAEEAQSILSSALRAGIPPSQLREVESLVARALTGPLWEQTFEFSSRNFTVRSDVDRQTCFDAAQELESALRLYQMRLDRIGSSTRDRIKSPVYVFSNRASYESYASDLFNHAPENTAGLFSPTLKQILVWIPGDKDEFEKTLRHEGLHQFLDALLGQLPTWLNEGLAEYFENTELVRGVTTTGRVDRRHLDALMNPSRPWIPFEELFELTPDRFYEDATLKYAQSWAVVHWLQNSSTDKAQLLQTYFKQLARGGDPASLGRDLLKLGDFSQLVDRHVRKLALESQQLGD